MGESLVAIATDIMCTAFARQFVELSVRRKYRISSVMYFSGDRAQIFVSNASELSAVRAYETEKGF